MFKKLIISVFLIFALTGGAYADKGADMPGGKFSIGEYGRDTYKNGWMGLSFTADKKLRNNSLGADKLVFYTTDEEALKRLDARDFDQAWAFSYALQRLSGTLHLYVVNLEKEQQNLGVVKDRDDYLDKLIAYINEDNKVLSPKLSEVYDTVLGGRSFKAFDMAVLGGEMLKRYYVQQIDGFLVVVEMVAAKNSNTNEELLAEYAACFTKYDAGQPSEPQNTPALDMGEYFDDGYRNAWLDVTFKAPQGYKGAFKEAAHGYLQFSDTDSQTLKLISRGDYSEIYAFTYQTTNPIGGVDMYVLNIKRLRDFEGNPLDTVAKYIAFEQAKAMDDGSSKPEFSKVGEVTLGGHKYSMYERKQYGLFGRWYIREVDGHFLVIIMASLNHENGPKLFKAFEKCFTKYK